MQISVFTVYEREEEDGRQSWGISSAGWPRQTVRICADGSVSHGTVTQTALPSLLTRLARGGFRVRATELFYDSDQVAFVSKHPDFVGEFKGAQYVLFAEPLDVTNAIIALDTMAQEQGFNALIQAERHWVTEQLRKNNYLVATDTSPTWALLIAELAIANRWPVTASRVDCPTTLPSKTPIVWLEWLQKFFARDTVTKSQRDLGWVAAKLINQPSIEIAGSQSLLPVDFLM